MLNMKLSAYNSQKIKVLSFIAIMMVLYIHAVYAEAKEFPLTNYVQEFCAFSGLSFIANPLFYCISGFLFFCGIGKVDECYPKIKKRIRTLLVPYLMWNIIFVLWYVVLCVIPGVSKFVNSDIIGSLTSNSLWHALKYLFLMPAAFQLWFLRDLIIYVIISPLIYICLKKFRWGLPTLLFIIGTIGLIYLPSEIKLWGAFFFVLGGYIAMYSSLDEIQHNIPISTACICLAIYILNAFVRPLHIIPLEAADMIVEFCGLIAIWRLYDVVVKKENNKIILMLAQFGCYSFFIYLFHEPAFNIIKKIGLNLFPLNDWFLVFLYLVNPIIMVIVAICIAKCLQVIMPKIYSLLVGGRLK